MRKKMQPALIFALALISCSQKNGKTIIGKLSVPKEIEIYNSYLGQRLDSSALPVTELKIYTTVNVSCSSCILRLSAWDKVQSEMRQYKVSVIPICRSEDKFELIKYLFENNNIDKIRLPLVLDLHDQFIKQNQPFENQIGELTVLTDASNNVLFSGDLIGDASVKKKFIEKIQQIE